VDDSVAVDERMTGIVERVFERCYADGGPSRASRSTLTVSVYVKPDLFKARPSVVTAWTHAMGVAIESRRLDRVRETLDRAPQVFGA
jgi:hypothetical protein